MLLFRRCLLALLLLFAVPLTAASSSEDDWLYQGSDLPKDPAWQIGTLPNGVRYAIRRNALPAGRVSIRVRIAVGSLNEEDNERGWAHFIEHLAFRGTKSFEDHEARNIWQQMGASPGSDTNAATSPSQTIYRLDLPKADRDSIDRSLTILSEMMDSARIEPAAVDSEHKVVLAEKSQRTQLADRIAEVAQPHFNGGLKVAERNPIGTEATLAAATPDKLRAFYERWYRPDLATVVIVGDADPAMLKELLTNRFGGWTASGPKPHDPNYGTLAPARSNAAMLVYPSAPHQAQLTWYRPYRPQPLTVAGDRVNLLRALATLIVNRRLEGRAREGAAFLAARISNSQNRFIGDTTSLALNPRDGRWREALQDAFAVLADALRAPPSGSEIDRELSNLRASIRAEADREPKTPSPQLASNMLAAIESENVRTAPNATLLRFETFAPGITPAQVGEVTKTMLNGTGPRILLVSPDPVAGGTPAVAAALASARGAAPAQRPTERLVSIDSLPKLGRPGTETSREFIPDMGVTIVRFANGSSLTHKRTDFNLGVALVQTRFGSGLAGLSSKQQHPLWMASSVVPSGFADFDFDAVQMMATGRRLGLVFNVAEDRFVLNGQTNVGDLTDQLRLMAIKLAYPRWDDNVFNRSKATMLQSYDTAFASANARARREDGAFLHPGDQRWTPWEKDKIAAATPADFRRFFEPLLASGAPEVTIVGDVTLDQAVAAVAATIGSLPERPPAGNVDPTIPPRPNDKPQVFTHKGSANQAIAIIGWSTFGGSEKAKERRSLAVAAAIIRTRLLDRLREQEGATYSPNVSSSGSAAFPAWGALMASAQIKPESVDTFFRIAREEIADLGRRPVSSAEFTRALNPIISNIEQGYKRSEVWLAIISEWASQPEMIVQARTHLAYFRTITPDDVRAAVAAFVADEGDWSMLVLPEKTQTAGK